jgi:hypothetical protein
MQNNQHRKQPVAQTESLILLSQSLGVILSQEQKFRPLNATHETVKLLTCVRKCT